MPKLPPTPADVATRVAQGLGAAWAEADLTRALARGAALLAELSGSPVSALFVLNEDGVGLEAWHPEGAGAANEQRTRFQGAALLGIRRGPKTGNAAELRVERRRVPTLDRSEDRAEAALVWVRLPAEREDDATRALSVAVVDALAAKVAIARRRLRYEARQEQYERWFKTLDAQLRILDRERQKFAAVANQSDTYAFVTDASRTVQWLNKAMASILGADGSVEWTGRSCSELCAAAGVKNPATTCDDCSIRRAFEANDSVHRELTDAPAGRELYLTALPIKGPDGNALEVLALIQDLTNLEVVRRAKERLETVISGAPIVLFATDKDGILTLSEGKGLEGLGLRAGETVGRSVFDLYREVPEIEAHIRRALTGETSTQCVEVRGVTFESYCSPLRSPDGAIQGVIGVATDVTERRRAERALQESEERLRHAQRIEAVGSLAGGVAHDFNNLLTAMFGHLKFLGRKLEHDPGLMAELGAIERSAERAATLTRQLLAFSRKQVLQLRIVDLNRVVLEMEPMLRRIIREDIDLVIEAGARSPWIRADIGQMEQVVVNLAVNARDAMPGGGSITVRTSDLRIDSAVSGHAGAGEEPLPAGEYVSLVVADTGSGMDAETRARAFEPFFTTKPVGEGTGLGLSTVYGIVKQSGGDVLLSSVPGAGATFALYFPRAASPEPEEAETRPSFEPAPVLERGTETILLVEDERVVRELFRDVLEQAGYRVLEAASGAEALEIATSRSERIDLMVTDVVMPGMGGGELVHRMAEARPDVKVLYVSGYADDVLVRRGVIDSKVPFLPKPCMPDDLARTVRRILG